MNNVYAYMITRADTKERVDMFRKTVEEAIETAGMPFTLSLHILPGKALDVAAELNRKYEDVTAIAYAENVGQHVITNSAIDVCDKGGYTYLLRLDDDIKFLTKRWLVKLTNAGDKLGDRFVTSPTISGLLHPPTVTEVVEHDGVAVKFLMDAIGGICRLHHIETLRGKDNKYISDVRQPLGFGDATGMGKWCKENNVWMVYLDHVRVKHAKGTRKQISEDKEYHQWHSLFQHIPYVPAWRGEDAPSS